MFHHLDEIEGAWLEFQGRAHGTFYQTYQWCKAWQETAGAANGVRPRIVTGRDLDGRLLFLLPFGLHRSYGCVTLDWLGGDQNSYGLGLYDKGFMRHANTWFANQGWLIFDLIGRFDAINLNNMPGTWNGFAHPLSRWFSIAGANQSFVTRLEPDFDKLYASKRSAESRRGNRKRDAKLMKNADVRFGLPANRAEAHSRLDEMFGQQQGRLAEQGIHGIFGATERAFIHHLVDLPDRMQPVLLPYHLTIDGEMEAMMLGGCYGGGYWALISSIGTSATALRHSPGDAALRRTIAACCGRGLEFFDFSSGRSAYKLHWADEAVSLHHTVRARTPRGYAWALVRMTSLALKRAIKASPLLWQVTTALRRHLAGSSSH
ncbi:GNAT family N-acetyltransferase [soil metagenome]